MRRREFIAALTSAAAWPAAVQAQQGERMRRIGVLMNLAQDDPQSRMRINTFLQRLRN
jgi:putative ABC transport system substrate-binding protein